LESIRPDGRHGCKLGPPARYSCTVYPATEIEIEAPGVIGRVYGNNSPLGEPSGEIGADVKELTGWFVAAGLNATPVLHLTAPLRGPHGPASAAFGRFC
jgi:2-dehydropantoate 2-reductase